MNLQKLINSQFGVMSALYLGRIIPPGVGHPLSRHLARQVASRRDQPMMRAIRANQRVVSAGRLSGPELDQWAVGVVENTARCLYDYYHTLNDTDVTRRMVDYTPAFENCLDRTLNSKQGVLIVAPHLSNFELALRAIVGRGLNALVLSYPEPPGGYRLQNEVRRRTGLEIAPLSISTMRQASERLQSGGYVVTGVDRPVSGEKYRPHFFGRPAALPVTHVRLALKTRVPVLVLGNQMLPDGRICLDASDPIAMKPHPDLTIELERNAEAILEQAASFIRRVPQQWSMFYPVWPEALLEAD
jgi:lauroyl/myristoyl acyltransferase